MINSSFLAQQAKLFAKLAKDNVGEKPDEQLAFVLHRVLQRKPTAAEIDRGVKFLAKTEKEEKVAKDEALRQFCLLALNLNEFLYLD